MINCRVVLVVLVCCTCYFVKGAAPADSKHDPAQQVLIESQLIEVDESRAMALMPGFDLQTLAEEGTKSLRKLEDDGAILVVSGPTILVEDGQDARFQIQKHLRETGNQATDIADGVRQISMTARPQTGKDGKIHLDLKVKLQDESAAETTTTQPATRVSRTRDMELSRDIISGKPIVLTGNSGEKHKGQRYLAMIIKCTLVQAGEP